MLLTYVREWITSPVTFCAFVPPTSVPWQYLNASNNGFCDRTSDFYPQPKTSDEQLRILYEE